MTKEDWNHAEQMLHRPWPYGRVTLLADGYEVTLELQMLQSMFSNGIAVYVNGAFKGRWLTEDCEERRRFIPQREKGLLTRKGRAAYNKLPKKQREELKKYADKTYTVYASHWTNWSALVKHFEGNNDDIRLKDEP